jgi:hypothetical protein
LFSRPPLATLPLRLFLSSAYLSSNLRICFGEPAPALRSMAAAAETSGVAMLVPDAAR